MFNQKTPGTFNFMVMFQRLAISNAHSLSLWLAGWKNGHSCDNRLWWNWKIHPYTYADTHILTANLLSFPRAGFIVGSSLVNIREQGFIMESEARWAPHWYWVKWFLTLNHLKSIHWLMNFFLIIASFIPMVSLKLLCLSVYPPLHYQGCEHMVCEFLSPFVPLILPRLPPFWRFPRIFVPV